MLGRFFGQKEQMIEVHVVVVDGCIGGGKSSALENVSSLAQTQGDRVVVIRLAECIDDWMTLKTPGGKQLDLLTSFTKQAAHVTEPNTFAGPFQMVTIASLLKRHNEMLSEVRTAIQKGTGKLQTVLVLVERSMIGNRVFADMQHAAGNISDTQATAYNYFWQQVADTHSQMLRLLGESLNVPVVSHHVLLECDAEECARRVNQRPRSSATGEGGLPLDYLKELVCRHDAVYTELTRAEGAHLRVHRVDSTQAPLDVAQNVMRVVLQS